MLDSCVCIDFMRGRLPRLYELFRETDPAMFKIPAVVEAELRLGAEKSQNPAKNRILVERFLEPFDVAPLESRCAFSYAQIRAQLESEGALIGPNDLMIAATAVAHQAILITENVREFKRVPGLSVECWGEVDI